MPLLAALSLLATTAVQEKPPITAQLATAAKLLKAQTAAPSVQALVDKLTTKGYKQDGLSYAPRYGYYHATLRGPLVLNIMSRLKEPVNAKAMKRADVKGVDAKALMDLYTGKGEMDWPKIRILQRAFHPSEIGVSFSPVPEEENWKANLAVLEKAFGKAQRVIKAKAPSVGYVAVWHKPMRVAYILETNKNIDISTHTLVRQLVPTR